MIDFVFGGVRSGKSSFATKQAKASGLPVVYVATCRTEHLDSEMAARITRHQRDRPSDWKTIENRFDLNAIAKEPHLAWGDRLDNLLADGPFPDLRNEFAHHLERHIGLNEGTAHFAHGGIDIGLGERAAPGQLVEYPAEAVLQCFKHVSSSPNSQRKTHPRANLADGCCPSHLPGISQLPCARQTKDVRRLLELWRVIRGNAMGSQWWNRVVSISVQKS